MADNKKPIYTKTVTVQETGEEVEVSVDAETALAEVTDKIKQYKQLLEIV